MTSSEQIRRDELEPIEKRLADLRTKRDALTSERRALVDERAIAVANASDSAEAFNASRLGQRIDRLQRDLEPIGDAITLLERKYADGQERHRAAAVAEGIAAARAGVDQAYADATAARSALKAAIATFVCETLPPLIAANAAAAQLGVEAVAALRRAVDAERPGASDGVGAFNVELFGDARLANVVHLLQPLASSLRVQPFARP